MGVIWRVIVWSAGLITFTLLSVTLITASMTIRPATAYDAADVIVVFGAGMAEDGRLHQPSVLRVKRGVELFNAGIAPTMHFTGGRAVANGPAAGDQMAALAIELGVPDTAITRETESLSTLQNALYSVPFLKDANRAVLVTEGFHLPRAAVAMMWSGGPKDIQLAPSTKFRNGARPAARMILREAAAWWFNGARGAAYSIAGWFGVPDNTRQGWLD